MSSLPNSLPSRLEWLAVINLSFHNYDAPPVVVAASKHPIEGCDIGLCTDRKEWLMSLQRVIGGQVRHIALLIPLAPSSPIVLP
jgi:hypothetical protein